MTQTSKPSLGTCQGEFCEQLATCVLVNGSEQTHYCDQCLREAAGELVMDNDSVSFYWNADHTVVTL